MTKKGDNLVDEKEDEEKEKSNTGADNKIDHVNRNSARFTDYLPSKTNFPVFSELSARLMPVCGHR